MKKISSLLPAFLISSCILLLIGCKPNGDKNSTDDEYYNSNNKNAAMMQSDSMISLDSSAHRDSMNMNR